MDAARLLLVMPDPATRALAGRVLASAGFDVVARADSAEEAISLAERTAPDVVVIGSGLPAGGMASVARRLGAGELAPSVVVVLEQDDPDVVGDLVAAGITRFVPAGRPTALVAGVGAAARGSSHISEELGGSILEAIHARYEAERQATAELRRRVAELQTMSITDSLTGLRNHGFFFDRLYQELERSRRYDRPLTVLIADLDDFKKVNDTFGHGTGDAVLREVGAALASEVREVDVACRIGGEEFGLILPETDPTGGVHAAERIRQRVDSTVLPAVGHVTISVGVAVYPYHATDAESLVEAADRALYEAKRAGKNRTHMVGGARIDHVHDRPLWSMGPVAGTLLSAVELRAAEDVAHARDVAEVATAIGLELDLAVADVERLRLASLLADVGMLAVPDEIRRTTEPLDAGALAIIREHPRHSHRVVEPAVHASVAEAVLAHHEAWDGTGYPLGLAGKEIPLMARIIGLADAYTAMAAPRPHRRALVDETITAELERGTGSRFDPGVVAALNAVRRTTSDAEILSFPA